MSDLKYYFDVEAQKDRCIGWIKDWFNLHGGEKKTAIVGISGGKDSAVVAALCKEALGAEKVVGVLMPNGKQTDIDDAVAVAEALGLTHVICANIRNPMVALQECILEPWTKPDDAPPSTPYVDCRTDLPYGHISKNVKLCKMKWSEQALTNTPARVRMAVLYAVAANYGGRVANTCNLSEDMVGYATLYGDSAGDFAPISKFTVTEVIAIGKALGLPDNMVEKTPSDGLCGKTDEESLGMTYKEIDEFIRTGKDSDTIGVEVKKMWENRGKFKLELINIPCYVSWIRLPNAVTG